MVKAKKEVYNINGNTNETFVILNENGQIPGREDVIHASSRDVLLVIHLYLCGQVETIVVHSMHERKVEMAKRVRGFFGLPGGFGTFEEVRFAANYIRHLLTC